MEKKKVVRYNIGEIRQQLDIIESNLKRIESRFTNKKIVHRGIATAEGSTRDFEEYGEYYKKHRFCALELAVAELQLVVGELQKKDK